MNKLQTYYFLKWQKDELEKRLARLSQQIKDEAVQQKQVVVTGETLELSQGGYKAKVQVKQGRPKIDEGLLEQLLEEKGILQDCTSEQLDDDLVEEAYILGKITDSDLRSINQGSPIQLALSVERIEEEDV